VARRIFPQPQTDGLIVAAALEHGVNSFAAIGRAVGMTDSRTVRKFVARLRERIDGELAKLEQATATPTAATPAPLPTRAEREEMLSDGLLVVGMHQLGLWKRLHPAALRLADRVQAAADHIEQIDPGKALTLLNGCSRFADRCQKIAQVAIEVERLRVGTPTAIVEVQLGDDTMSVADVIREGTVMIENLRQHEAAYAAEPGAPPAEAARTGSIAAQPDLGAPDPPNWQPQLAASAGPSCCGQSMIVHGADPRHPVVQTFACHCGRRVRTNDSGATWSAVEVVVQLPAASAS
jgi:hypothetical protein